MSAENITRKQIKPGITLVLKQFTNPTRIMFVLENETEKSFIFVLDISSSENLKFARGDYVAEKEVEPFGTRLLGTVVTLNDDEGWNLKYKMKLKTQQVVTQTQTTRNNDGSTSTVTTSSRSFSSSTSSSFNNSPMPSLTHPQHGSSLFPSSRGDPMLSLDRDSFFGKNRDIPDLSHFTHSTSRHTHGSDPGHSSHVTTTTSSHHSHANGHHDPNQGHTHSNGHGHKASEPAELSHCHVCENDPDADSKPRFAHEDSVPHGPGYKHHHHHGHKPHNKPDPIPEPAPAPAPAPAVTEPDPEVKPAIGTKYPSDAVITDLDRGLSIVRQRIPDTRNYLFSAFNPTHWAFELTVDISKSTNLHFEDRSMSKTVHLDPDEEMDIGLVVCPDETKTSALRAGYASQQQPHPSEAYTQKANRQSKAHIKSIFEAYKKTALFQGDDNLTLAQLKTKCREENITFIDTEFMPISTSLYKYGSHSPDSDGSVVWRRAKEFLGSNYDIFEGGIEPQDIKQGKLGNCWLMCSLAALAEFPETVKAMFKLPSGAMQHADPHGVYQVRLFKNGQPRWIRLDDFFPCTSGGGPIYSRAHGNELWVLLIEKAFAKVTGCYDMLRGGLAYEALMDLTGCPAETFTFSEADMEDIWKKMKRNDGLDNIMSASVPGEDKWSNTNHRDVGGTGLISGHAYSLIDVFEVGNIRLVKLRNPWGNVEWNGAWSDKSPEWDRHPEVKRVVKPALEADDGLFHMSLEDMFEHYKRFNICYVNSESGRPFKSQRAKGFFEINPTHLETGHVTASRFELILTDDTEAWISIHQDDERQLFGSHYLTMGVALYRQDASAEGGYTFVRASTCQEEREVQLHFGRLFEGRYIVVPLTLGMHRRIHRTGYRLGTAVFDPETPTLLSHEYMTIIMEIFRRYDGDMNGFLGGAELRNLISKLTNVPEDEVDVEEFCRGLDVRQGSGLTRDGLVGFFQNLDETRILECLENLGYQDLMLENERVFVLSCHATCDMSFKKLDSDQFLIDRTFKDILRFQGTAEKSEHYTIYTYSHGYHGSTLGVTNNASFPIRLEFDFNGSQNIETSHHSMQRSMVVKPGDLDIIAHIQPKDNDNSWSTKYGFRILRA